MFHQFSGSSILVLRFFCGRFGFSVYNQFTILQSVPCVISSIILLTVSATPGIVTTRIGSRAEISAGCRWGGVDWISIVRRGTELNLWSRYHSRFPPTLPGKSLCTKITHSPRVFPHKMDCGNPITNFSVTNLQSLAAATGVKVFPRPIPTATSAPGISAF